MATKKFTNTNKLSASKLLRAERRLDLMLHLEAINERILRDSFGCSHGQIAEKMAKEAVSLIEGIDDMLSQDESGAAA